jgi:hypothetical protein
MSDILWVQKPGNEFSPKMAFLDALVQVQPYLYSPCRVIRPALILVHAYLFISSSMRFRSVLSKKARPVSMSYRLTLARWLHKRMSHLFTQAIG